MGEPKRLTQGTIKHGEDSLDRRQTAEGPSFIPNLRRKGYAVEVVSTGAAALDRVVRLDRTWRW